ncbi:MAG: hypothetical protein KDB90_12440 [Planctomycetes bacterium]|nr:hypothetical protein [Planctomycetota bacterium]
MKYVVALAVLLVAGCAGSRIRSNYTPPQPEPKEVREHPEWNPSANKAETGEPPAVANEPSPTSKPADDLWITGWKIGVQLEDRTFEVQQPSNPVRKMQRFEVWRGQTLLGMAIVESARAKTARLRLDRPKNEDTTLAPGDIVLSRLWLPTRDKHVALHGEFKPPTEQMSRQELEFALELAGCTLDEKLTAKTDLVIIGHNLLGDDWYRRMRSDLHFEVMKASDAAAYFDPPN